MKRIIIISLLIFVFIFNVTPSLAGSGTSPSTCNSGSCIKLTNPLGSATTPELLIGRIINTVLGLVGSIALLMFVYGGLTWMTSSGNDEKVKKGRDIILWSAIGLVVIFMSYALTRFVLTTIAQ